MSLEQNKPLQLPLAIRTADHSDLENYFVGDNQELFRYIQDFEQSADQITLLWGNQGVGVSFLLQALSNRLNSPYIPLTQIPDITPDIFDGLEDLPLVCIDDLDKICGRLRWQERLFHFFNLSRQNGNRILFGSHMAPAGLKLELEDLQSRLFWGQCFQVAGLTDEQKLEALINRAGLKGLVLEDSVAQYLLSHYPRDLQVQFKILDCLDEASLSEKRKLTIPFIKEIIK